VNLEDGFARLHLARLCAAVVHSDQAAGDVGRDGAPFWRMLCALATRCALPEHAWPMMVGSAVFGLGGCKQDLSWLAPGLQSLGAGREACEIC
jgi:hypothetical protein